MAIWHIRLDPGATWALPPAAGRATNRMLYVFEGATLRVAEREVTRDTGVAVAADTKIELSAGPDAVEALMLQGRPIDEPVARYGPFVMNDRAGIEQAIGDYQRNAFGGWPWPSDDPVHPADQGRFARHADGREVHVEATLSP